MTQHKGFILAGCYIRLRKLSRINCYHATICHIFTVKYFDFSQSMGNYNYLLFTI